MSKFYRTGYVFIIVGTLFLECGRPNEMGESAHDTTLTTQSSSKEIPESTSGELIPQGTPQFIRFSGTTNDDISKVLETFPAFNIVYQLSTKYVALQDSLEAVRKSWGESLTDPKDTMLVFPFKDKAYRAIVNYKKQLASRSIAAVQLPTLLELTRIPEQGDSSLLMLPPAQKSDLLTSGEFFFVGGAPFISKQSPVNDSNFFSNDDGKPEIRFGMSLQDNLRYLLPSIYNARPNAIDVKFGPPLHSYEMGQVEVYGIGSLIHEFVERVPSFFITEEGLIKAELLSASLKLGIDYDCGSGPVYVEFGCSEAIDEMKILAVFIPYAATPTSATFARLSDNVWTADLNSDGIDDFACVTNNYMGEMGYTISEALWYVNINGQWKIIDWAEIPECT